VNVSIHGRDSTKLVEALKTRPSNLAIITDSNKKSLEIIKKNLSELNLIDFYDFWLCEEIGFNNENIRKLNLKESLPSDISSLNIVVLTKAKKIPIGGGFHNWHYENTGLQVSARKLVIQLYLNTLEEGGETEFLYINKRIKAEQGRLIIFPAAFTHTHRGNPPIGQDKYIVSTWAVSQDNNWR